MKECNKIVIYKNCIGTILKEGILLTDEFIFLKKDETYQVSDIEYNNSFQVKSYTIVVMYDNMLDYYVVKVNAEHCIPNYTSDSYTTTIGKSNNLIKRTFPIRYEIELPNFELEIVHIYSLSFKFKSFLFTSNTEYLWNKSNTDDF